MLAQSCAWRRLTLGGLALSVAAVLPLSSALAPRAAAASSSVAIPASGLIFGAAAHPVSGETYPQAFSNLEQASGRQFNLHRDYLSWDDNAANTIIKADVAAGVLPAVSVSGTRNNGSSVSWASIASGAEDATIIKQANAFKSLGVPVLVAFDPEPENNTATNGTAADYQAAFRHWVSVYRAQGANNVSFAWILMATSFGKSGRAATFYPGDSSVDWIGVDGYNWYQCRGGSWRGFSQILQNFRNWTSTHAKPLFIGEFGTTEDPAMAGRKGQWFRDALTTLQGWPQVKAVSYFNNGNGSCDWSVNTTSSSLTGWQNFATDAYMHPAG